MSHAQPRPTTSTGIDVDPNQANLPDGYLRQSAIIPIDQPRKFLPVAGRE